MGRRDGSQWAGDSVTKHAQANLKYPRNDRARGRRHVFFARIAAYPKGAVGVIRAWRPPSVTWVTCNSPSGAAHPHAVFGFRNPAGHITVTHTFAAGSGA
ncbi:hypothetical protein GCM10027075_36600 [Streptomyces heilongjiangensis]